MDEKEADRASFNYGGFLITDRERDEKEGDNEKELFRNRRRRVLLLFLSAAVGNNQQNLLLYLVSWTEERG